jgi:hypothetical protein
MIEREFLITAHPRSGTGYMANLFQANGYDVGHEVMGEHGTSNWQFAVKSDFYPFDIDKIKRQDCEFKQIIHVIRHPLFAINSIAFTEGRSEAFRSEFIPITGNPFERAIYSYYGWNMLIKSQRPDIVCKLEEAKDVLNFANDCSIVNVRQHEFINEDELLRAVNHEAKWYYFKILKYYNNL